MAITNPSIQAGTLFDLSDYYKRVNKNNEVDDIVEVLNQSNEIMQDIVYKEGNTTDGMRVSIRTGLPSVYWKQFYKGTPPSKSAVQVVTEQCGMMSAESVVDKDLIDKNGTGTGALLRSQEDKAFIEAIAQQETYTLFKGNYKKTSEGFSGFETRYSDGKAENAKNIIDASNGQAQSDKKLTSIWLIGWGDNIHGIYPKGSVMGLQREDMGEQRIDDGTGRGTSYWAYVTRYMKNVGLVVKDWRYAVRIANVDVDELRSGTGIGNADVKTTGSNLITMMLDALTLLPADAKANFRFYMNRDVFSGLNNLSLRMNTKVIEWQKGVDVFGKNQAWSNFNGIPMRRVDQLTNDEKHLVK